MAEIKILHTADLHIGAAESFLGEKKAFRQSETLITFERIADTAAQNDIGLVLIAGDLLNSNSIDEAYFKRIIDKIAALSNILFVFAAGNHDPLNSESPFKKHTLPANLHVLDTKDCCIEFRELSLRIYGRSFGEVYEQGRDSFTITPQNDDFINIMCIHGERSSSLSSNYNSITDRFIENSKMDYIALGHVHEKTDVLKIGNTHFAYCGCPEGQGFDELGHKGVYVGTVKKGEANLSFMPIAKRQHISPKIDITGLSDETEIAEKILYELKERYGEGFGDNLYKIILIGETDENFAVNLAEISSRISDKLFFVKLKDKTEIRPNLQELLRENSLKGVFAQKLLEEMEGADENKKQLYISALKLGLKAFKTEVSYNED